MGFRQIKQKLGLVVVVFGGLWIGISVAGADSIEPIQPIETPGVMIGAYYMPIPASMTHQWVSMYKFNQNKTKRWPLLGLYDGSNPEVLSWQIKWAVENGISFFVFDWYWEGKKPRFNTAIPAFLASPYNQYMKFTIAVFGFKVDESFNYVVNGINLSQRQDHKMTLDLTQKEKLRATLQALKLNLETMADYWVDNYFQRSNYLKTNDGKPVVILPLWDEKRQTRRLLNTCRNLNNPPSECQVVEDPTKVVEDRVKQRMGVGLEKIAMRIWGSGWGNGFYIKRSKYAASQGYSAITAYGFGDKQEQDPQNYPSYNEYPQRFGQLMAELSCGIYEELGKNFKIIPSPFSGFDNTPLKVQPHKWLDINSQDWYRVLQTTKNFIENGSCKDNFYTLNGKKVVILASWNEWGENTAIEPGIKGGGSYRFDYINKVRLVFGVGFENDNIKPDDRVVSDGPNDPGLWQASADWQEIGKWHVVHGLRVNPSEFYLFRTWNEDKKQAFGGLVSLIPVYSQWEKVRYFYLKFKAWCGDNYDQACHWQSGMISWTNSVDKRATLFSLENKVKFWSPELNKVSLPGQVNRVWVDLKGKSFYQGQIQQASLQLRTKGQKGRVKILEVGFTDKIEKLESLDVNQNGVEGDRGDILCFIVNYLKQQGQPIKVGMGDFYDINLDGVFNRQDVIGAIVRYLQDPKGAGGGSCVGIGK